MSDPDYEYMCFRLASVHRGWRDRMGFGNTQPTDDELKQKILDLDRTNPALKAELTAEAIDWCARDDAAYAKYRPVPPPAPTGRYAYNEPFIPLSLDLVDGLISRGIEQALDSGDTVVVPLEVVEKNANWLFFIDAIDVAWGGKRIADFIAEVKSNGSEQRAAEILYHRVIQDPRPAFLRFTSCRITAQYNGQNNHSRSDSPQYGDPQDTLDGRVF
ncbi:hypothetical protein KO481_28445 [Nocardia sp. NEAU-G5]|uniref:Uncharacterized protein n=1 Tax=Nocardia albiluteola TaxID=2842303 RepID=A0ABS6B6Q2_9NOCA|nr:hypothetical protein [Nocardia albiluteola]MBU3065445.1 hypothetical protein [Nocardia albiluteola]